MERQEEIDFKRAMAAKPRNYMLTVKYTVAPIPDDDEDIITMECLPLSISKGDNDPI